VAVLVFELLTFSLTSVFEVLAEDESSLNFPSMVEYSDEIRRLLLLITMTGMLGMLVNGGGCVVKDGDENPDTCIDGH